MSSCLYLVSANKLKIKDILCLFHRPKEWPIGQPHHTHTLIQYTHQRSHLKLKTLTHTHTYILLSTGAYCNPGHRVDYWSEAQGSRGIIKPWEIDWKLWSLCSKCQAHSLNKIHRWFDLLNLSFRPCDSLCEDIRTEVSRNKWNNVN